MEGWDAEIKNDKKGFLLNSKIVSLLDYEGKSCVFIDEKYFLLN